MDLVEDLAEPSVSVSAACTALGVSRATLYRATAPSPPPTVRERAPSPRRLSDDERQAIVDVMHAPEFVDQPPMEVFAKPQPASQTGRPKPRYPAQVHINPSKHSPCRLPRTPSPSAAPCPRADLRWRLRNRSASLIESSSPLSHPR